MVRSMLRRACVLFALIAPGPDPVEFGIIDLSFTSFHPL
jgi:hypothetical protein